jgi:Predicted metal-dependent membrane protease
MIHLFKVFTRKVPSQVKWMLVLVIFPLYFYCSSIIGSAMIKFLIITFSLQLDYTTVNCYLNFIVDLSMLIIVGLTMKKMIIDQWNDFKKDIKENLLYGCVVGTLLIYGVNIVGGMITLMLGGNASSENQQLVVSITMAHPAIMVFTTVVLAPLLEEFIFRGMVFGWLYEWNPKIAHFVSAFIFGFIHVMSAVLSGNLSEWIQIFSYFFMGGILSYLYEKKNNIFVPILTHSMNNLISMLMILL